jgi:hypothetical protein
MWDYSPRRSIGVRLWVSMALLLSPLVASAGPLTLYTDREAFLAAANPNKLETFDGPTSCVFEPVGDPPLTQHPSCRADFGDVEALYFEFSSFPEPLEGFLPMLPTFIQVSLPPNAYAVGFDFLQAAQTGFNVTFPGDVWFNHTFSTGCADFSSPPCETFSGFVGVISTDENVSIPSFAANAGGPGSLRLPGQGQFSIPPQTILDNMVMQVPEPATALLMLGGAVVLLKSRRFMRVK